MIRDFTDLWLIDSRVSPTWLLLYKDVTTLCDVACCMSVSITWLPLVKEKSGKFKVREKSGNLCGVREI